MKTTAAIAQSSITLLYRRYKRFVQWKPLMGNVNTTRAFLDSGKTLPESKPQ